VTINDEGLIRPADTGGRRPPIVLIASLGCLFGVFGLVSLFLRKARS